MSTFTSSVYQAALCSLSSRKGLSIKLCITERNILFYLCLLNSLYLLFALKRVKIQGHPYKYLGINLSVFTVLWQLKNWHSGMVHRELVAFVAETREKFCNTVSIIRSSIWGIQISQLGSFRDLLFPYQFTSCCHWAVTKSQKYVWPKERHKQYKTMARNQAKASCSLLITLEAEKY